MHEVQKAVLGVHSVSDEDEDTDDAEAGAPAGGPQVSFAMCIELFSLMCRSLLPYV